MSATLSRSSSMSFLVIVFGLVGMKLQEGVVQIQGRLACSQTLRTARTPRGSGRGSRMVLRRIHRMGRCIPRHLLHVAVQHRSVRSQQVPCSCCTLALFALRAVVVFVLVSLSCVLLVKFKEFFHVALSVVRNHVVAKCFTALLSVHSIHACFYHTSYHFIVRHCLQSIRYTIRQSLRRCGRAQCSH